MAATIIKLDELEVDYDSAIVGTAASPLPPGTAGRVALARDTNILYFAEDDATWIKFLSQEATVVGGGSTSTPGANSTDPAGLGAAIAGGTGGAWTGYPNGLYILDNLENVVGIFYSGEAPASSNPQVYEYNSVRGYESKQRENIGTLWPQLDVEGVTVKYPLQSFNPEALTGSVTLGSHGEFPHHKWITGGVGERYYFGDNEVETSYRVGTGAMDDLYDFDNGKVIEGGAGHCITGKKYASRTSEVPSWPHLNHTDGFKGGLFGLPRLVTGRKSWDSQGNVYYTSAVEYDWTGHKSFENGNRSYTSYYSEWGSSAWGGIKHESYRRQTAKDAAYSITSPQKSNLYYTQDRKSERGMLVQDADDPTRGRQWYGHLCFDPKLYHKIHGRREHGNLSNWTVHQGYNSESTSYYEMEIFESKSEPSNWMSGGPKFNIRYHPLWGRYQISAYEGAGSGDRTYNYKTIHAAGPAFSTQVTGYQNSYTHAYGHSDGSMNMGYVPHYYDESIGPVAPSDYAGINTNFNNNREPGSLVPWGTNEVWSDAKDYVVGDRVIYGQNYYTPYNEREWICVQPNGPSSTVEVPPARRVDGAYVSPDPGNPVTASKEFWEINGCQGRVTLPPTWSANPQTAVVGDFMNTGQFGVDNNYFGSNELPVWEEKSSNSFGIQGKHYYVTGYAPWQHITQSDVVGSPYDNFGPNNANTKAQWMNQEAAQFNHWANPYWSYQRGERAVNAQCRGMTHNNIYSSSHNGNYIHRSTQWPGHCMRLTASHLMIPWRETVKAVKDQKFSWGPEDDFSIEIIWKSDSQTGGLSYSYHGASPTPDQIHDNPITDQTWYDGTTNHTGAIEMEPGGSHIAWENFWEEGGSGGDNWSPDKHYVAGNEVSHNGTNYTATATSGLDTYKYTIPWHMETKTPTTNWRGTPNVDLCAFGGGGDKYYYQDSNIWLHLGIWAGRLYLENGRTWRQGRAGEFPAGIPWLTGETKLENNKWYHFAVVKNSEKNLITLYVNGKIDAQAKLVAELHPDNNNTYTSTLPGEQALDKLPDGQTAVPQFETAPSKGGGNYSWLGERWGFPTKGNETLNAGPAAGALGQGQFDGVLPHSDNASSTVPYSMGFINHKERDYPDQVSANGSEDIAAGGDGRYARVNYHGQDRWSWNSNTSFVPNANYAQFSTSDTTSWDSMTAIDRKGSYSERTQIYFGLGANAARGGKSNSRYGPIHIIDKKLFVDGNGDQVEFDDQFTIDEDRGIVASSYLPWNSFDHTKSVVYADWDNAHPETFDETDTVYFDFKIRAGTAAENTLKTPKSIIMEYFGRFGDTEFENSIPVSWYGSKRLTNMYFLGGGYFSASAYISRGQGALLNWLTYFGDGTIADGVGDEDSTRSAVRAKLISKYITHT